jgi:NAD(P)-dependent dehydrogenase (short-subunit alcohol dehydrogenase family)
MTRQLAQKRVLITGASSGLGAQFARSCAAEGAKVVIAARRLDRLEALAAELKAKGAEVLPVQLDVEQESSIISAFDQIERAIGGVDVLFNNAGMNARGLAVDISAEDFDTVMNVNVRGVFLVAREFARRVFARAMPSGDPARIINIASIGALKVLPGVTAYCTSKAAVVMMTKSLAREWARKDINVNAICPGYIATEINDEWLAEEGGQRMIAGFPRKRVMEINDLDGMALLLAGPAGRALTGGVYTVDDGQSL